MKKEVFRYGLGLDISAKKFHACITVLDNEHRVKTKHSRAFTQSPAGFAELLKWLQSKLKGNTLFQAVMESTGVYHENLLYFLHDEGFRVCLVQGKIAKRYRQSCGIDSKNDKLDGYVLARMALERNLHPWKPAAKNMLQIKNAVRYRNELMTSKVAFQNRLHARKHAHQPEAATIASIKALIKTLEKQIKDVEKRIKTLAKKDTCFWEKLNTIIESFPGVGFTSLITIIAETNGFEHFKNVRQLVSYAGLDVVENQSGKFTGKTRISKNGNANLRKALYMPSLSIVRDEVDPFYTFYLRIRNRNPKIKKKALVAVQRKVLITIYTLWTNSRTFDPLWHTKQHDKTLHNKDPKNEGSSGLTPELHGIEAAMLTSS